MTFLTSFAGSDHIHFQSNAALLFGRPSNLQRQLLIRQTTAGRALKGHQRVSSVSLMVLYLRMLSCFIYTAKYNLEKFYKKIRVTKHAWNTKHFNQ